MSSFRLPPARYIALALGAIISTHFLVSYTSPAYASNTSLSAVRDRFSSASGLSSTWIDGKLENSRGKGSHSGSIEGQVEAFEKAEGAGNGTRRANAAFVILARNSELWEIIASIRGVEDRFNRKYHYPYVFLNDEEFSDDFKKYTSGVASAPCTYGLIPHEQWGDNPAWIDEEKAAGLREQMEKANVIYGGSLSYRKMCRYQSGFFWRHPLLDTYEYYWRIEPGVKFFCNIDYDPFLLMSDGKKKYGFVVTIFEYAETIVTLWDETKKFIKQNPQYLAKPNMMDFLSDDGGDTYNRCHFWSNFEIASLDFWRGEAYTKYFEALDQAGGFFYERWGDAPVHSIAAALFLKPEEMHFFQDIGYRHEPFQHCPKDRTSDCACNPEDSFEDFWYSCTPKWKKVAGWTAP